MMKAGTDHRLRVLNQSLGEGNICAETQGLREFARGMPLERIF